MPTEVEATGPGQIVIVLEDESAQTALAANQTDSLNISLKKEKDQQQPRLSAVNQLEVRVLRSDNLLLTSKSFTASGGRFSGSIQVLAQNDLKVLCIGRNNGVVERFGIDDDVDVPAGATTTAVITGWNSLYIPRITSISPNPSTDGSFRVSWSSVTGATGYVLQEATNSSFSGARQAFSGSGQQASISGKSPGTYFYRVQATNNYNVTSSWSDLDSVQVSLPPPSIPIPILSDPGDSVSSGSSYTVCWCAVSDADSYTIEEATDVSFSGATTRTVSDTSQVFSHSVSEITTCYYRVRANSASDSSDWSNIVDLIVYPTVIPSPILSDPGNSVSSDTSYTVVWSSVKSADSYTIQEATDISFSEATSRTVKDTSQVFSHSVSEITTYYYRVRANSASDSSKWSNIVDMRVVRTVIPPPILSDPGDSISSDTSYTASWSVISGADSYTIEEATDSSFREAASRTVQDTSQVFSHSVSEITTYYYRVRANSASDNSDWSNIVDIVVKPNPPDTPVLSDPGDSVTSGTSYTLTWNRGNRATSYTIIEGTDRAFSGAVSQTVTDTTLVFSHIVSKTTTYYYIIKAYNEQGSSGWSNIVDMVVNPPSVIPLPPPVLNDPGDSVVSGTSYTVSWSSVTGAISYTIEWDIDSSFSGATSRTVSGTSSSFAPSVTAATTYYYRVRANTAEVSSGWSNIVDMVVNPSVIPPPVLTDPGESVISGTSFTLSWSSVTGATSYTIEEATDSSFSGATSRTVSGTSYSFTPSVTAATTYYYRVKANTAELSSGWSNIVDMVVNPFPPPVLNDPGESVISGTSFTLSWSSVTGATSYTIEEATNISFSGAASRTVSGTSSSFVHNVNAMTTYYYRVRANTAEVSSGWSNIVDMVVNPFPPPVLNDPGESVISGTGFTLSWSSVTGATSYTIEEAANISFSGAASRTVSGTSYSFAPSVTAATTYYYRVRANTAELSSGWSNSVDIIVNPPAPTENIVKVTDASGTAGSEVTVQVLATSSKNIAGVAFEVLFYVSKLQVKEVKAGSDASSMALMSLDVAGANTSGTLGISMVDFTFANPIPAGTDREILVITFTIASGASGDIPLTLTNVSLADESAADIPVTAVNGTITVTGPAGNYLKVTNASGFAGSEVTVQVLANSDKNIAGADFEVSFDVSRLQVKEVKVGSDASAMTLMNLDVAGANTSGILRISMVDFTFANPIPAGTDREILTITFTIAAGATGDIPLTLSDFSLADESAADITATAVNGTITVSP